MPSLLIQTNVPHDNDSFSQLSTKLTEFLTEALGKHRSYIQIALHPCFINFGNQSGPSAHVYLGSIGLTDEKVAEIQEEFSKLIVRYVGAPASRTYIVYEDIRRERCSWNNRLFH